MLFHNTTINNWITEKIMIEASLDISLYTLPKLAPFLRIAKYSTVFIELIAENTDKQLIDSNTIQQTLPDIQIYFRKTLGDTGEKSANKSILDYWRNKVVILSQRCKTPETSKWAAQDHRLDALQFPPDAIHQLLDLSTARIMSENNKILEINLGDFLYGPTLPIGYFRNLIKTVKRCLIKDVPIIFLSQASNQFEIIGPYEVQGFSSFIGLANHYFNEVSQKVLKERIQNNLYSFSTDFIAPGITKYPSSNNS